MIPPRGAGSPDGPASSRRLLWIAEGHPMTESEWNACCDPWKMLEFLLERGGACERKLRLFACGCCRRVWQHLDDERSRNVVEAAERRADGEMSRRDFNAAR